ncbi:glycosyltransferase family 4 protein [candidate division KSB1 bacterium]|nr:glycosyltransferase family 4 protein [candidate division KSB1 bacterium]NIS27121.1 glycosyltransferase family 4 protein [candidate division KSB1 bacterium]NIT74007.1 glycosyltransferase family 4 protein [candidate division KSB1 bacterium]NIU90977.1 hypothetical protein [candidate division KSB1 bacterium]NIW72282.1 hypothetical protein [candidate division KSB1 bacterium]
MVAADCPSGPREVLAPDADPHDHTINKNEHTPYGILTPMGDRMQLAEAITEMLSDDKVRQTYKVAAQKRASDFALAHILKEYEQLWADDV